MYEQLSIFDLYPTNTEKGSYPPIIDALDKELRKMFKTAKNGKYEVWQHVKHFGKRYTLYVDANDWDLTDIIKRYKAYQLEVSVCAFPSMTHPGMQNLMISTMWLTKGYQENTSEINSKICTFSMHECNKVELWKVAESLDDINCPHSCCRMCDNRLCGARCNGA